MAQSSPFIKQVNTFTDYGVEAKDIDRQRKMAELLQQQSAAPIEERPGVPISWTQGLAKMLQAYYGKQGIDEATQKERDLAGRAKMEATDYFGGMPQAKTTDLNPVAMDDEGNMMPPALQTTQPTRQEMMSYAMKGAMSGNPLISPVSGSMLAQYMKPEEDKVVGPGASLVRGANAIYTAPFKPDAPARPAPTSNLSRLMSERDSLPAGDPRRNAYDNAIRKESETAKQISPTIVMPKTDKVPMGYRVSADGNLEAIPGGPADVKAQKQAEQVDSGRGTVNNIVAQLRDSYDQLEKGGGITNPESGAISNMGAAIASSGVGQTVGKLFGTQNQSLRNNIAQTRPLLLNAIKQATGMSAKQMDSNAELKMYLAAATDPTLDIKANRQALDMLDKLYGIGGGNSASKGATGGWSIKPVQ